MITESDYPGLYLESYLLKTSKGPDMNRNKLKR